MSELLTKEMFQAAMPTGSKNQLTDQMVTDVNGLIMDQGLRENYRDNLLGFASVLAEGRFKMADYINAVRYVSYKLLGLPNNQAYSKTFPDRMQRMISENYEANAIHGIVYAYNNTILVNKIFEQSLIPVHIINADLYQRAINKQAELMADPEVSYKVQSDAANSLLMHLKPPEAQEVHLKIGIQEDKTIQELRATTLKLVEEQKNVIKSGIQTVKQIAHSTLIHEETTVEGELVEE